MGSLWGGSSTHVQVGTSISRMVPDNLIPETTKLALVKKLKGSTLPLHEELRRLSMNSITPKINQLFSYAKESYYYGLPENQIKDSGVLPVNIINRIIQNEVAKKLGHVDIKIIYTKIGGMNSLHYGWLKLFNDFKYNPDTNKIKYNNKNYTFKDMQCIYNRDSYVYADKDIISKQGIFPSERYYRGKKNKFINFMPDLVGDENSNVIRIFYGDKGEKYFDIPMLNDDKNNDYFQVMYEYIHPQLNYVDDSGKVYGSKMFNVWTYKDNSGIYPALDKHEKVEYRDSGSYLPMIYLRQDKEDLTLPKYKETQPYLTAKKCMSLIGLNIDDLSESLHKNDMSDVYEVFTMFGIELNTKESLDMKYLYKYFEYLDNYFIEDRNNEFHIKNRIFSNNRYILNIRDRKNGIGISFNTIFKRTGSFGGVPETYTRYKETLEYDGKGYYHQNEDGTIPNIVAEADIFRRQISDKEYEEIVVIGIGTFYEVVSGESTYFGSNSSQALIPIDIKLLNDFSLIEREILLSRSIHLVINSYVETKDKWWQTGVFKIAMVIVAIAITWFYPPLSAAAWKAVLAMSIASQITIVLLLTAAQSLILPEIFKVVVDVVGVDIALIAAAVAIAYGGYHGLAGTTTDTVKLISSAGSQLLTEANNIKLQNTLQDIYDEYGQFNLMMEDKMDALRKIQNELESSTNISLLKVSGLVPLTVIGESPEDFLTRTSYIDLASHQQSLISNFAEITTRLRT
ncbi:MAG: hypothetical protein ACMV1B_01290 [Prevotella sp.]